MSSPVVFFCLARSAIVGAVLLSGVRLSAQSNPPAAGTEDVITLSPFTITADSNNGYQSQVTLSGAGLRVSLDDIASSVSVVTREFFEDTGSRDIRDVLVYQLGIEVGGAGGNFAGSTNEQRLTNNFTTRVRGLAAAELTRGFFRSMIPNDAYNTDRVDINRGANALLFGVGSPAGIINYSTIEATAKKNLRRVAVSADNFGSVRATFDGNQVIVPGVMAARVALLNDNHLYKQEPAYNRDQRSSVSLVTRIPAFEKGAFSGTLFKVSGEIGSIKANNPRNLPPQDHLSGWFEDTIYPQWVASGIPPKGTYNAAQIFNAAVQANAGLVVSRLTNRSPVAIFPDPTTNVARDVNGTANGQPILGRPWVSNNFLFPNGTVGTAAMVSSKSFEIQNASLTKPIPDTEFYITPRLEDPTIFDYFNLMLDGPNKEELSDFSNVTASVEQLFFKRQAGLELAANFESYTETTQSLLPIGAQWLAIDANSFTWDGTPNTNFGRVYTGQPGEATYLKTKNKTFRAKAFYELDIASKGSSFWHRLLGKHTLAGLYQSEEITRDTRNGSLYSTAQLWENGTTQNRNDNLGKQLTTLHYLTPNTFNLTTPAGLNIQGVQTNRMDLPGILNGKGVFLARKPGTVANAGEPAQAVKYEAVTFFRSDRELSEMSVDAVKNRREIESSAISLQSKLLDGHIIGTYGLRHEEVSTAQVVAPVITNGENYRLVNDARYSFDSSLVVRQKFSATPKAWSVVAKLPDSLGRRVPGLSKLGLFYGKSENFSPPEGAARNVFGEQLAPPRGLSTDYGVNLRLLDDKLSLRVTRYETNQEGSFNGSLASIANLIVDTHLLAYNSVKSGYNVDANGDGFPDGYVAPPQQILDLYQVRIDNGTISRAAASATDTSDFIARGTEVELFWSVARNLSLGLNVAQQKSVRNNSGAALRRFIYETPSANGKTMAENWASEPAKTIYLTTLFVPDSTSALSGYMRNVATSYSRVANADGAPATELREWRGNVFANYEFSSGALRGFGGGGAIRYQSKAAIGLPITSFRADGSPATGAAQPGDFRAYDVTNPYYGPSETDYDMWLSYRRPVWHNRVHAKFQLNIRNLFADNRLIPIASQPDGSMAVGRISQPTTYSLTAQFDF